MEECVRLMQQRLRVTQPTKRAKSVYALKNLGTIRDKKKERKEEKEKDETSGSEIIMRILRMRYNIPLSIFRVWHMPFQDLELPNSLISRCKYWRCRPKRTERKRRKVLGVNSPIDHLPNQICHRCRQHTLSECNDTRIIFSIMYWFFFFYLFFLFGRNIPL